MTSAPRQAGASGSPTTDELLAMAYADGELSDEAAREFEARLVRDARLRVLVADQQRIAVLAREAAPGEPLELASLIVERAAPLSALAIAGRVLLSGSIAWIVAWLALACFDGAWRPPLSGAVLLALSGAGLLAYRAWSARSATRHLDPYRDVRR